MTVKEECSRMMYLASQGDTYGIRKFVMLGLIMDLLIIAGALDPKASLAPPLKYSFKVKLYSWIVCLAICAGANIIYGGLS